ncbi:MAG TPA: branched-chain amino acid ABC transporter permease [Firmicutes bacterium]|nr:branched-chain amino acid ABC transporter permease [Bacillota bacterium]
MSILSNLINGISLGSVYAIIALGYTMVYGIAKMLNFAHGDVIMVGAYVSFFAVGSFGLPPVVGLLLSVAVCTVLGIVIEGLAYRPLRQAPSLAVLITAIGVSYFLQNSALLLWKSDTKIFPNFFAYTDAAGETHNSISLFGGQLTVTYVAIFTVVICIIIMLGLTWFTGRTKLGKAMRACSEDKGAAQLMGINVNRTISMTFAIGSALAGVAAVLLCSAYQTLTPTTGSMPGIKAFTAAVFGGIGSIPGAFLGGILLGVIETFAKVFNTQISDAVVFAVLIIILLVKPSGLLGKTSREKV